MKFRTLAIASLLLLVGCFKQHDEISIKSDGAIAFQTEITITETRMKMSDVEAYSKDFAQILGRGGWKVTRTWISKDKPYRLRFQGEGNLKKVAYKTDFYRFTKVNDKIYKAIFIPIETRGNQSSRSITFNCPLLGGAKIFDSQGHRVTEIPNVLSRDTYLITL